MQLIQFAFILLVILYFNLKEIGSIYNRITITKIELNVFFMSLELSIVLRRLEIHVKTYHNISRKNVVKD